MLEEMPVQETLDGIAELRAPAAACRSAASSINMVRPAGLPEPDRAAPAAAGRVDEAEIALGLKAAGLDDSRTPRGRPGRRAGRARQDVAAARSASGASSPRPGQPRYELPLITDGIDLAGLYRLAEALREQGAA